MGLNQQLLAIKFDEIKNVEDFPKKFRLWDYTNEDGEQLLSGTELAYFININILQGYFERKYDVKNLDFVQVSKKRYELFDLHL